jgi:hypothetical protein
MRSGQRREMRTETESERVSMNEEKSLNEMVSVSDEEDLSERANVNKEENESLSGRTRNRMSEDDPVIKSFAFQREKYVTKESEDVASGDDFHCLGFALTTGVWSSKSLDFFCLKERRRKEKY